jgi:apolipoprotein D and lipocalin family protein
MRAIVRGLRAASRVLALAALACGASAAAPPPTAPHVDLQRYLGVWHEMARYDNRFQDEDCVNVTAEYGLRDDGDVSVRNTCRNGDGAVTESVDGRAYVADTTSNAKLRVTFFWPFFGDYWIVALADDYSWVIVSEPSREYLWILTRTPVSGGPEMTELVARAGALGFDTSRLRYTQEPPR